METSGELEYRCEGKGDEGDVYVKFDKGKKHDFDLEFVLFSFKRCLQNDNLLLLKEYLNAFYELCRFFRLTGRLFGFVAKDIESKIKAIEYRVLKDKENNYHSIQSMLRYEISKEMTLKKGSHPSGSRTLLRLHHALEFILAFMERIRDSDGHAKTSKIAWDVYCETLSKHHPWITRKLAFVAVYALPSKQDLIEIMCKHDYDRVMKLLLEVTEVGQHVYNVTQDVFESNALLVIP